MLAGLSQDDHPLTLQHVLERARRLYADSEVATVGARGTARASYGELCRRVDRLCSALESLGVRPGDRVATFAWNTQAHLELYLAVPCMGAVLHTINFRLFADQIAYIAGHAEDAVVFVDDSLVPRLEALAGRLGTVRHYVVVGDGDTGSLPGAIRYEELLAAQRGGYDYPDLDDRAAAALCYTSGTTGNPKGVLYSHRCNLLHAAGTCMTDSVGVGSHDRVLPIVPMFHANAWGLPYAALLTGADLVLPGASPQAGAIARTIAQERVTVAGAVPTVWLDVLRHVDEHGADLSWLRTVVCGGAAVPLSLMRAFEERYGVRMIQAWGMTETG
ncbi:MAG: AMP-binding protein, partial [Solirubrobacteraceae bacterium]